MDKKKMKEFYNVKVVCGWSGISYTGKYNEINKVLDNLNNCINNEKNNNDKTYLYSLCSMKNEIEKVKSKIV